MNITFAVVTIEISPGGSFVSNWLAGTADDLDAAFRIYHKTVERELPHWDETKTRDVHARRCIMARDDGNGTRQLIVELLTHHEMKKGA